MAVFRLAWRRAVDISHKYPITRGVLSYGLIWPIGSIVQQTFEGKQEYDWARVARFSLFGACWVAPTLHNWMKFTTYMWPQLTLKIAVKKALIEQVTFGPFANTTFYFGMTLLEGRSIEEAKMEVTNKFLPTYKAAICYWPFIQTINFLWVPVKNRLPFLSVCSLFWTTFLAYMKNLEGKENIVEQQ